MQLIANIASIHHNSLSNGPGPHSVIHFQGCDFNCPGCFNTGFRSHKTARQMTPQAIVRNICEQQIRPRGVVLSGGEPLLQKEATERLLMLLKEKQFPTILYTGFSHAEILEKKMETFISRSDLVLFGRYVQGMEIKMFPYTASKKLLFFSDTYQRADFENIMQYEVHIGKNEITFLGFPSLQEVHKILNKLGL